MAGTWTQRRRIIRATLTFCASSVAYVILWPGDAITAPVRSNIAMALVALAGSTVGSYVFGAVWDDFNARKDRP
jgi:uncharacterized membrane protein